MNVINENNSIRRPWCGRLVGLLKLGFRVALATVFHRRIVLRLSYVSAFTELIRRQSNYRSFSEPNSRNLTQGQLA